MEKNQVNKEESQILAERKRGWNTAGEKLLISLREQADGVLVSITSRPRKKGAIVDGGRNIENVEEIARRLREMDGTALRDSVCP